MPEHSHHHAITEQQYLEAVLRTYEGQPGRTRNQLCLSALGLAGESGEVVDQIKKHLFQGHPLDKERLIDELGDLLWYYVLLCHYLDCTLTEIMQTNVHKLLRRYPDGFAIARSLER